MSGITGTYRLDQRPAAPASLRAMVGTLAHRGPDRNAIWHEGAVGMGHCLLHTTPEAARERQPLVSPRTGAVLTADARIDNRDELLARLPLAGRAADVTDAALILAAYERWGGRCAGHLVGAFAFALWDPAERRLLCARDHFGVKPLRYYYRPGHVFAFASENKALLTLDGVPRVLNETRIGDALATLDDATSTAYQGIRRLPPAHVLTVPAGGPLRLERYWQLEAAPAAPQSDEAYTERFRELLFEAVRCRTRSTTAVTSQLSGGLDSSAVTGVAHALHVRGAAPPVEAVSITTDDVPEANERAFIEAVVDYAGLPVHYIRGDRIGPLGDLDAIYSYLDDEPVSGNHHFIWHMLRTARAAGSRVMLDGFDGDTTVSHGMPRFTEMALAGQWGAFAREAGQARRNHASARHRQATQSVLAADDGPLQAYALPVLRRYAQAGRLAAFAHAGWQAHRHLALPLRRLARMQKAAAGRHVRRLTGHVRPSKTPSVTDTYPFINAGFAGRIGLETRASELHVDLQAHRSVYALQWILLSQNHLARLLELFDHYAAAHGVELRHPFLDKRLVEFCLALPSDQSFQGGWTRMILRRALRGLLPEAVRWRNGKAHYTPNFARGLFDLDGARLAGYAANLSAVRPYVDVPHVQAMVRQGPAVGDAMMTHLCKIISLAHWLGTSFGAKMEAMPKRREPSARDLTAAI